MFKFSEFYEENRVLIAYAMCGSIIAFVALGIVYNASVIKRCQAQGGKMTRTTASNVFPICTIMRSSDTKH